MISHYFFLIIIIIQYNLLIVLIIILNTAKWLIYCCLFSIINIFFYTKKYFIRIFIWKNHQLLHKQFAYKINDKLSKTLNLFRRFVFKLTFSYSKIKLLGYSDSLEYYSEALSEPADIVAATVCNTWKIFLVFVYFVIVHRYQLFMFGFVVSGFLYQYI